MSEKKLYDIREKIKKQIEGIDGVEIWSSGIDTAEEEIEFSFDYKGNSYIASIKKMDKGT